MRAIILLFAGLLLCTGCKQTQQTEVLVAGGSVSGVAAALQAARQGAEVILVSPHQWLGGMLTAAGVSATDGNHKLPSGIWGEFREALYQHYGGPRAVATGWVSNTQFEPHVGDSIFKAMVARENNIRVLYNYRPVNVHKSDNTVKGATFINPEGNRLRIAARITIDATELGDVMAMADVPYDIGQDARSETGEAQAPEEATSIIQDMTYVAILKDYKDNKDHTLEKPADYQPKNFKCCCRAVCDTSQEVIACDKMLDYGKLPNDKYMINWPNNGNDYYANIIEMTYNQRQKALEKAKNETRAFVHFLQTQAGYTNLGLAKDEFPTSDHFPLIPYHREARRMEGIIQLTLMDIKNPYQAPNGALYKTGIATGDYPVDHHHKKYPGTIQEGEFPKIPSFSVPYVCLLPPETNGLLVAEKSISVTHLTNGTTRLQPVVLQIGQAAGSAAALSIKNNKPPRKISIRRLQKQLLEANCWILPFVDTHPESPYFEAIMHAGANGWMRGEGQPHKWANRTWFYPDSAVTPTGFSTVLRQAGVSNIPKLKSITLGKAACYLQAIAKNTPLQQADISTSRQQKLLQQLALPAGLKQKSPEKTIVRKELAWLIDKINAPFKENIPLVPRHKQ